MAEMFAQQQPRRRQGGQKASRIGRHTEEKLREFLEYEGYARLSRYQREMLTAAVRQGEDPAAFFKGVGLTHHFVLQTEMFQTIYHRLWKTDAFIYSARLFSKGLVVEVKSQDSSGSVDQKIPFALMSLEALRRPALLLMDGDGATPASRKWAKEYAASSTAPINVITNPGAWNTFRHLISKGHVPSQNQLHKAENQTQLL